MGAWEQILEQYYNEYGPFLVQKYTNFPHEWYVYNSSEYKAFLVTEKFVNNREVFKDEIVFDIDMDKDISPEEAQAEALKMAVELCSRLKMLKFSHISYKSGGTGCHIHMFFPELKKLSQFELWLMKKVILKKLGYGMVKKEWEKEQKRKKTNIAYPWKGSIQIQAHTLIQLEYCAHRKGGKKEKISSEHFGVNKIPDEYYDLMEEAKQKFTSEKKYYEEFDKNNKPEAIKFLESKKFCVIGNGRDRAAFILIGYYKKYLKPEEVEKRIFEWNKECLNGYLPQRSLKAKIKSTRPCLAVNALVELFDDLGIDQQYIESLQRRHT